LHWMDRASEELLANLVAIPEPLRLLILHTRRPDYAPAWAGQPRVTQLTLEPLSARETSRIAQARLGASQAELDEAALNESYTRIVAPVSGILVHRAEVGAHLKAGDPVFDIVDPITDAVTTLTTRNDGIFYMRRAIRFVIAGAPLGRVSGAIPFRTGVLIGA